MFFVNYTTLFSSCKNIDYINNICERTEDETWFSMSNPKLKNGKMKNIVFSTNYILYRTINHLKTNFLKIFFPSGKCSTPTSIMVLFNEYCA